MHRLRVVPSRSDRTFAESSGKLIWLSDPDDEHVLKPPVWGVGWALNVGRVVELIRRQGGGETAPVVV